MAGGGGKGGGKGDSGGGDYSDDGSGDYQPPSTAIGGVVPGDYGSGSGGGADLQDMAGAASGGYDPGPADTGGFDGGYSGGGGTGVAGGGSDPGAPDIGGGYAGGDGGDLPPGATVASGDTPPQLASLMSASNVTGPAGTGGAPNVAALVDEFAPGAAGTSDAIGDIPESSAGAGPSASGVAPFTVGGTGSTDLSSSNREKTDKTDANWLTSLGIKNPVGSAIAAAGLGYNMLKGQTQPQPVQDLSKLVADLRNSTMGPGGITPEGRQIATTGAANLNTRASELDPLSQELQTRGAGLTRYVGTGTLPPEMQAQVDQATKDAKTARMSFYASRGMPTDPTQNTALRTDLEGIDRQAVIMASTMASDLAKTGTGIADTGLKGTQLAGGFQKSAADVGTSMVQSGLQSAGIQSQAYAQLAQIDAAQAQRTQQAIAAMAAALSGTPSSVNLKLT